VQSREASETGMKTFGLFASTLWVLAACSMDSSASSAGTQAASAGAAAGSGASAGASAAPHVDVAGAGVAGAAANSGGAGAAGTPAADGGDSSGIAATFATVKLVFGGGGGITTCAAAPCHGVNGAAPPDDPLELPTNNDEQLYATLTSYVSKACGNSKLVERGKPAQSALVAILKGPCGMTPRMPYGCSVESGDCIPDEYIAAVSKWIESGARRE